MTEREKIADIIKKHLRYGCDDEQAMEIAREIIETIAVETLRDKFAGQALTKLIGRPYHNEWSQSEIDGISIDAFRFADAMLTERDKEPTR